MRKLPMFSAWGEYDVDDLFHEALAAIRRGHHGYDPERRRADGKRIAYSTFAYIVGSRRLLDLWRAGGRRAGHELAFARSIPDVVRPHYLDAAAAGDADDDDDEIPLQDWLAQVFVRARFAHRPGLVRRGRKWFSVPHAVAAVLLMRRLRLSCRAAADLLEHRSDLRGAMRLNRLPSYGWFHRARRIVRRMENRTRANSARRRRPTEACAPQESRNS